MITQAEQTCMNRLGSAEGVLTEKSGPTSAQRKAVGVVFDRCVGRASKRTFLRRLFKDLRPPGAIPCVVDHAMAITFLTFYSDRAGVDQPDERGEGCLPAAVEPTAPGTGRSPPLSSPPMSFPEGFVWGTATAAHQVEGSNTNSDFWLLEHAPGRSSPSRSGDPATTTTATRDDIALLAELGFGAYRFSVEWARIEPEEGGSRSPRSTTTGACSPTCHEHGVEPCVTFHHFTSPRWFTADGGWEDARTADRFARFCERAVRHLGDLIDYACTLNEANLGAFAAGNGISRARAAEAAWAAARGRRCGSTLERFGPFLLGDRASAHARSMRARTGWRARRSRRGRARPGRHHARDAGQQARPGGEERRDARAAASRTRFSSCARGRLHRRADLQASRFGPDGRRTRAGRRAHADGLRVTGRTHSRRRSAAPSRAGVPVCVTENGIGTPTTRSASSTFAARSAASRAA